MAGTIIPKPEDSHTEAAVLTAEYTLLRPQFILSCPVPLPAPELSRNALTTESAITFCEMTRPRFAIGRYRNFIPAHRLEIFHPTVPPIDDPSQSPVGPSAIVAGTPTIAIPTPAAMPFEPIATYQG